MHRDNISAKLDLCMQSIVKIVASRDGVLLHLEEVEIKDASKINLD